MIPVHPRVIDPKHIGDTVTLELCKSGLLQTPDIHHTLWRKKVYQFWDNPSGRAG